MQIATISNPSDSKISPGHFLKIGQTSRSRSLRQKSWYSIEGLATRNAHIKSLPLLVKKLWPRLKIF